MEKNLSLSTELVYSRKEIMPYGKIGSNIDRSKVFQEKVGIYYPRPINWHKSVNEQGEFDADAFTLSRYIPEGKRIYLEQVQEHMNYLEHMQSRGNVEGWELASLLNDIIVQLERTYFLGNEENIYKKDFYKNIKEIHTQIVSQKALANSTDTGHLFEEVKQSIEARYLWEGKERTAYTDDIKEKTYLMTKKYVQEDQTLNVDAILGDLNGGWEWSSEALILAFYTARCSREELQRLQQGVSDALNSKIKRLDTKKVFTIIERILPYIHDGFKIDFTLPEIFSPEYIKHISVYDLTLGGFTSQVRNKGEALGWSQEIQNRLIDQFKLFGQSQDGKIGFGQGSEELRYRQEVTGGVTESNFKYYLKDPNLGVEKMPIPRILQQYKDEDKSNDLIKALE